MINFPSSPANGQQYTNTGRSWQFNATVGGGVGAWQLIPVTSADVDSAAASALAANDSMIAAVAGGDLATDKAAEALASANAAAATLAGAVKTVDLAAPDGASLAGYALGVTVKQRLDRTVWLGAEYGATMDGSANCSVALLAALTAAGANGVVRLIPGAVYLFTSQPENLGTNSALSSSIVCDGWATFKFSGLGAATDCFVARGSAMRQTVLDGVIFDCNNTGRDGLVQSGSDHPLLRVVVKTSVRDALVLLAGAGDWLENGDFDVSLQNAGRHAIRQELAGATEAFINEMVWRQIEIRGVGKVTAGGQAMRITSTCTHPGAKFADQIFIKTNVDAQYNGTGAVPSTHVIEVDSGVVQNWRFLCGGWENIGSGALAGGKAFRVSGTGVWDGLTVDSTIDNSLWGNGGIDTAITKIWNFDYAFGVTRLAGPILAPTNPAFYIYPAATDANATGDGTQARIGVNGVTTLYNRSDESVVAGIFTAPQTGVYRFEACGQLNGLGVAHTECLLRLVVASGAYAGTYTMWAGNPYVLRDGGSNLQVRGSYEIMVEAGVLVYATILVAGGAKTVGVAGGFTTASFFAGRLAG